MTQYLQMQSNELIAILQGNDSYRNAEKSIDHKNIYIQYSNGEFSRHYSKYRLNISANES